jgi:hypothetical protein
MSDLVDLLKLNTFLHFYFPVNLPKEAIKVLLSPVDRPGI